MHTVTYVFFRAQTLDTPDSYRKLFELSGTLVKKCLSIDVKWSVLDVSGGYVASRGYTLFKLRIYKYFVICSEMTYDIEYFKLPITSYSTGCPDNQ